MDMQYLLVTMTRVLENCGLSERETYGQVPPRNDIILFPLHAAGSLLVRPFVCGRGRVHLLSFVPSGQYQFYNTCTSCCFIRRWQNSSRQNHHRNKVHPDARVADHVNKCSQLSGDCSSTVFSGI